MPESDQGQGPEESAAEQGAGALHRQDMAEKPAGFRASHPPTQTDVEIAEEDAAGATPQAPVDVGKDAGDDADAVVSPPQAAKPGEKDDPDMKDMAVGPRPADEQSAQ
jgi:hypothetical protein